MKYEILMFLVITISLFLMYLIGYKIGYNNGYRIGRKQRNIIKTKNNTGTIYQNNRLN